MSRLEKIKEEVSNLILDNANDIKHASNAEEIKYHEEYGKNLIALKDSFMKGVKADDEERSLTEFFLTNDSLTKKMAERRKLASSGGLNSASKRAEINANIDFYFTLENVLSNEL